MCEQLGAAYCQALRSPASLRSSFVCLLHRTIHHFAGRATGNELLNQRPEHFRESCPAQMGQQCNWSGIAYIPVADSQSNFQPTSRRSHPHCGVGGSTYFFLPHSVLLGPAFEMKQIVLVCPLDLNSFCLRWSVSFQSKGVVGCAYLKPFGRFR